KPGDVLFPDLSGGDCGAVRRRRILLPLAARPALEAIADRVGSIGAGSRRIDHYKAASDLRRGMMQESLRMPAGQVLPISDDLGEPAVPGGTANEQRMSVVGEFGAGIFGHALHDIASPAPHQNVGHRFVESRTLRNGEQMVLAFGAGIL